MNEIYSVQIQLTRACNQRCYMCRRWTWPRKEMSLEVVENTFKKYFTKNKNVTASFTGGDPLSYSNIKGLNELIKKYGINYQIFTNGNYLLDDDMKEFLLNANNVQISLDGFDEETYAAVRHPQENGYNTVMNVINFLVAQHRTVKLNTTLSKINYDCVYGIIFDVHTIWNCMAEYDKIFLRIFPVHTFNDKMLDEEMKQAIQQQIKFSQEVFGKEFMDKVVFVADEKQEPYCGKCFVKKHHRIVDEDGVEYPCCRAINDNGFDIGQINKLENLKGLDDERVLYDFCHMCDRYRKFNNNWEEYADKFNEGKLVFL